LISIKYIIITLIIIILIIIFIILFIIVFKNSSNLFGKLKHKNFNEDQLIKIFTQEEENKLKNLNINFNELEFEKKIDEGNFILILGSNSIVYKGYFI
jgi:hypothetical protein